MSTIIDVHAREILDSRGEPTVEVEVILDDGSFGRASVPAGASRGTHEALELRDGDKNRCGGMGVLRAVDHVETEISEALIGMEATDQRAIDAELISADGSENKSNLGANAILGASLATARAAAKSTGLSLYSYMGGSNAHLLPTPRVNILNGGVQRENKVDFHEFMVIPIGASSFMEGIRWCSEIHHVLHDMLVDMGLLYGVGDEGGFTADITSNDEAFGLVRRACSEAGYTLGEQIGLAMDSAAKAFYDRRSHRYVLAGEGGQELSTSEMIDYWEERTATYHIISLEDPLGEEDWDGWVELTARLGNRVQIAGDDLFVTDPVRLAKGIRLKAANAILIKLNQIGTLTEGMTAIELAQRAGYGTIISHRSGDTADTTIADLAVAMSAGQIKAGGTCRSECIGKYNRLIRIEDELGSSASYAGAHVFPQWR